MVLLTTCAVAGDPPEDVQNRWGYLCKAPLDVTEKMQMVFFGQTIPRDCMLAGQKKMMAQFAHDEAGVRDLMFDVNPMNHMGCLTQKCDIIGPA